MKNNGIEPLQRRLECDGKGLEVILCYNLLHINVTFFAISTVLTMLYSINAFHF